ncbi:MAG: hypothetical protein HFG27_04595 [Provencibacterium sp.]|jgi:multidrug resistance efflux pump|nr:hypothetical protein [Provencibacterium sp.]
MQIKELLHWQQGEKQLGRQGRLLRLLAGFIGLMLVLTLISRAADSLTVARVDTETPKSGAIEHAFDKQGVLTANREVAATTLGGVLVESVQSYVGAAVQSGDLLFTLDVQSLQEQLQEKNIEKKKLQIQLQSAYLSQQNQDELSDVAQQRADEDYTYTELESGERVRRAQNDLNDARDDINDFWKTHDRDEFDHWWNDNWYNEADDWDENDSWGTIGSSSSGAKAELEGLMKAYQSAKRALADAVLAEEKALLEAERRIEDAGRENVKSSDPQLLSLNIQLLDIQIERLQQLIEANGEVRSPANGVVQKLEVATGSRTLDTASAVIAESSGGFRFTATLSEEEAKYAARGDKVTITLQGKQRGSEAVIESVSPSAKQAGGVEVMVLLSEGEAGQAASMHISKRSESFPQCVPLSALRGASGDQYVLVMEERQTVLGNEKVARRVNVSVSDSNDSRAAVSGALQNQDKVITGSTKNIVEGDRVRPSES